MRKTVDQLYNYPQGPAAPKDGQYRLRVYQDDGALPAVIATDATPEAPHATWIGGNAPRLAREAVQAHLKATSELRWFSPYVAPDAPVEIFEQSRLGVLPNGEIAYREAPRASGSPPYQPQAALMPRSEVEAIVGESLD